MRCGESRTSNFNLCGKKWENATLKIFYIESTSEFQMSVTFFINELKHKVWVVIFLIRL